MGCRFRFLLRIPGQFSLHFHDGSDCPRVRNHLRGRADFPDHLSSRSVATEDAIHIQDSHVRRNTDALSRDRDLSFGCRNMKPSPTQACQQSTIAVGTAPTGGKTLGDEPRHRTRSSRRCDLVGRARLPAVLEGLPERGAAAAARALPGAAQHLSSSRPRPCRPTRGVPKCGGKRRNGGVEACVRTGSNGKSNIQITIPSKCIPFARAMLKTHGRIEIICLPQFVYNRTPSTPLINPNIVIRNGRHTLHLKNSLELNESCYGINVGHRSYLVPRIIHLEFGNIWKLR